MSNADRSRILRFADAQARIPVAKGEHAVSVFQHGTLDVRLALAPRAPPTQSTSHEKDEVYVIVKGRGVLVHGAERDSFEPGDVLFVAAGTDHRFEDFSEDLAVWVIFFGSEVSNAPKAPSSHPLSTPRGRPG
jgi:mannose-6-phosphate isomerase-like protein (cupin superfamily)